jgi:asparagine synthase (glutamine-hydrolysing)
MRHRGPDEGGEVAVGHAELVFRRLALLDLDGGQQPVCDERGRYWSVFNGEVYNHAELRRQLVARGHHLHGEGDSELMPHLFEEWGPGFVERLRGMFAIAVYDGDRDVLFLARDRFGIKPLFVCRTPSHVVFGSEARTVMAATGSLDPDPAALSDFFGFGYVPDPRTMWRDLVKVPPAHHVTIRAGELDVRRYWQPRLTPGPSRSLAASADAITDALEDSVAAHMVADVPVGAYLSSGVDSSVLAALAARLTTLKTFSIGFDGAAGALDELAAARNLAARLGTEHHEEVINADDYLMALPDIVESQEGPLADPSAPALWFLARAAAHEVKAVLSGEGADELFAGYPIFRRPLALRALAALPAGPQRMLSAIGRAMPEGMKGKGFLDRATTPLEHQFLGNAPLFSEAAKSALLAPGFAAGLPAEPSFTAVADLYRALAGEPEVVRMQTVSLQTWLPSSILMKADKMAMAHSLEVRVPFLDPRVYDAAASLPLRHRVSGRQTKVALRSAAARVLPQKAAQRPKLGFPVPFRAWLDGALGERLRDLAASCDDPLLDRRALLREIENDRHPDRYRRQWAVLVYLLWRSSFVDATTAHPSLPRIA